MQYMHIEIMCCGLVVMLVLSVSIILWSATILSGRLVEQEKPLDDPNKKEE